MRALDQAEIIADLVSRRSDQPRRRKSSRAAEISGDIDIGVVGQRLIDILYSYATGGKYRYLEFGDTGPVAGRAKSIEGVGSQYIRVAQNKGIHFVIRSGILYRQLGPCKTGWRQTVSDVVAPED